ncbi:hypothetical protein DFP72DRAFT_548958 [Ephemerocybe angulata]|uniref:Uncharacterized protein n=1 Tax=Ephemerocybe angulata TaxID=980116 RepID=A0A8H6HLC2_9AGAR|nr:hypothetical protein DFP72DRAFT_548958 [Tulosesus angulatus]
MRSKMREMRDSMKGLFAIYREGFVERYPDVPRPIARLGDTRRRGCELRPRLADLPKLLPGLSSEATRATASCPARRFPCTSTAMVHTGCPQNMSGAPATSTTRRPTPRMASTPSPSCPTRPCPRQLYLQQRRGPATKAQEEAQREQAETRRRRGARPDTPLQPQTRVPGFALQRLRRAARWPFWRILKGYACDGVYPTHPSHCTTHAPPAVLLLPFLFMPTSAPLSLY